MTDITKIMKLVVDRDALQKEVTEKQLEINKLNSQIKKECPHPTTIKKSDYHPGGYYDRSETVTYDECTICKKKLNEKSKTGHFG